MTHAADWSLRPYTENSSNNARNVRLSDGNQNNNNKDNENWVVPVRK